MDLSLVDRETKDLAIGQLVRPCLISVSAQWDLFDTFVLADSTRWRALASSTPSSPITHTIRKSYLQWRTSKP